MALLHIALAFVFLKDFFPPHGPFFKVFMEFVTILLLFHVLVVWLQGMWDLSSLTRDQTCTPCIGRQTLNHWTMREVPSLLYFEPIKHCFVYISPNSNFPQNPLITIFSFVCEIHHSAVFLTLMSQQTWLCLPTGVSLGV